jgi:hypothetical protein
MLDNPLFTLLIQILIAGEATAGISGTPIAQSFQPQQQGVNSEPTVYLHKLFDKRYGSVFREDVWDANTSTMVHTESQQYETTFQLSALSTQNPATPAQYTASDLCNLCASILQSSVALATLKANQIGIERITDVRNPYFSDDRGQNEASPSFDFVITHKQIITSSVPIINATTFNVYEV